MAKYVNFDQMVDKINHELERSLSSVYFCEDGTKISADVGYVAEWFEDYVIKLHQIPLVDAVEVVHGEWIAVPNSGIGNTAKCSCCGSSIYGYKAMNYCCNCGADMRERKNDDE